MLQIEDEIEFIVNNLEYLVDPEIAIKQYFQNRNILYFLLTLNLLFESLLTVYIIKNEFFILKQLNQIYRFWHLDEFKSFFEGVTCINAALNSLMYVFGYFTIFSHKVTNYQVFTVLLMISIFFGILLTYLNALNLLMFILKCFTYIYTRYVLSQLYTVLIIPRDLPRSENSSQQDDIAVQFNEEDYDQYIPDALQNDGDEEDRMLLMQNGRNAYQYGMPLIWNILCNLLRCKKS